MVGRMCWLPLAGTTGKRILHLQTASNQPWKPYTRFPEFAVPDYQLIGVSEGMATYQKLFKAGWKVVSVTEVQGYKN